MKATPACLICSNPVRTPENKFCSSECYGESMRRPPRTCEQCGQEFRAKHPNRFCSRRCNGLAQRKAPVPCSVGGCEKVARDAGYCTMHRSRLKRTGQVEADLRTLAHREYTGGYRSVSVPGHPLAQGDGKSVYLHRFVLHSEIGPGEHPCHWCGVTVTWDVRIGPGALVVDHVSGDKGDNRLENLVPACAHCNITREEHPRLRRTACLKGHEYTPENTGVKPGTGQRVCLTCYRAAAAAREARRRASRSAS